MTAKQSEQSRERLQVQWLLFSLSGNTQYIKRSLKLQNYKITKFAKFVKDMKAMELLQAVLISQASLERNRRPRMSDQARVILYVILKSWIECSPRRLVVSTCCLVMSNRRVVGSARLLVASACCPVVSSSRLVVLARRLLASACRLVVSSFQILCSLFPSCSLFFISFRSH